MTSNLYNKIESVVSDADPNHVRSLSSEHSDTLDALNCLMRAKGYRTYTILDVNSDDHADTLRTIVKRWERDSMMVDCKLFKDNGKVIEDGVVKVVFDLSETMISRLGNLSGCSIAIRVRLDGKMSIFNLYLGIGILASVSPELVSETFKKVYDADHFCFQRQAEAWDATSKKRS